MKVYLWTIYLWLSFIGCHSNSDAGFKTRIRETYPELYSNHYQGDIFLFDEKEAKNAVRGEIFRWPNATIPYVIGSNFSKFPRLDGISVTFHGKGSQIGAGNEREQVLTAMGRLQNETCIKFVPRKYEKNYIYVDNKKGGCYAVIGYHLNANKPHPVNLESPGCLRHQGTIEHELLHVMGLYHEQSRADRDEHVIIYWGNITEEYKSNFEKASEIQTTTYNIPYDTNSVMHYPRFSFSKNGEETIVSKKDSQMKLGQRVGAAPGDLDKIRKMYGCDGSNKPYGSPDWFLQQINKFFNDNSKNGV